ncbi:MAG: hypothetical protein LBM70_10280 [Victivallales bacterium]|jgi:DNA-directed RNA polymerase subunit RPC12/RpoP|nr:hypothetical protein [Victivallales bacterium]
MKVQCSACGESFSVDASIDGQLFRCPSCSASFVIYDDEFYLAAKIMEENQNYLKISCPKCQQHYSIDHGWRNRPLACQDCGNNFIVPAARQEMPKPPPPPEQPPHRTGEYNARNAINEIKASMNQTKNPDASPAQAVNGGINWVFQVFFDFLNFKIMLIAIILKWLWLLLAISGIIFGIVKTIQGITENSFMDVCFGVLILVFSPLITHMMFEILMLAFSILDVLKEIRDKK